MSEENKKDEHDEFVEEEDDRVGRLVRNFQAKSRPHVEIGERLLDITSDKDDIEQRNIARESEGKPKSITDLFNPDGSVKVYGMKPTGVTTVERVHSYLSITCGQCGIVVFCGSIDEQCQNCHMPLGISKDTKEKLGVS